MAACLLPEAPAAAAMLGQRFHNQQQAAMPVISPCFGVRGSVVCVCVCVCVFVCVCVCVIFCKTFREKALKQDASFHLRILPAHSPSQSSYQAQTHWSHNGILLSPDDHDFIFNIRTESENQRLAMLGSHFIGIVDSLLLGIWVWTIPTSAILVGHETLR